MTDRDLARRVSGLTAGVVGLIALGGLTLGAADEAAGAIAGGAVTIANFLGLRWTAAVAFRAPAGGSGSPVRRALWLAAAGARFGAVAAVLGLLAAQRRVGLAGLLASLTALPAMVVVEGLRAARDA